MHHEIIAFVLATCGTMLAQTSQYAVVPAAYQTTDAVSYEWIAGASQDLRQQTLVGASHLQALLGRDITAIELRRTAANEVYSGGTANMSVTLSTSPSDPSSCSDAFAPNIGSDALAVFSGAVTLPTSPVAAGPTVLWTANNIVRIAFTQPFHYHGGTLCIDAVGSKITGQTADWWMADAMFEDLEGTVQQVGNGCGSRGGPNGEWSHVATRNLVPGAYAKFTAYGTPNGFGLVAFGALAPAPIPLSMLGLPAPNCFCYLQPNMILATGVRPFVQELNPVLWPRGGVGEYRVHIPNLSSMFGVQLTTQWFDMLQMASSNALQWTVASAMPSLDMALIEGHPSELRGEVSVHLAHVLRFEYQ